MADQPSRRLPSLTLPNEELGLHSLSEISTMRRKFAEDLKAKGGGEGKMREKSGEAVMEGESSVGGDDSIMEEDSYTSAPEEGMGGADDIDSDEEYRKEMEEQRLADRKNGHFSASSEGEEESSESRNEGEWSPQANPRSRRKPHPVSPANGQSQAAPHVARVSARVAAYEARMPSRVSGFASLTVAEDEGGKRESVAPISQSANPYLQRDHTINTFCLGDAENGGIAAVQEGERDLFYPTKAAPASTSLTSSDKWGTSTINYTLAANSAHPKKETASFNVAPNQVTFQPPPEVNSLLVHGKGNVSSMGSGEISGALNTSDLERVGAAASQQRKTKSLGHMPRGHGSDALPTRVLDVSPLSAFSAEEAAHLDLFETHPLLLCHSLPVSTFGPPTCGLNSFEKGSQRQPTTINCPSSQVRPSAIIPYKPNSQLKQFFSKPNSHPLPTVSQPNSHPAQLLHANQPNPALPNPKNKRTQKLPNTQAPATITQEIKLALFGNTIPPNPTSNSANMLENHSLSLSQPSAFPPLRPTNGTALVETGAAPPSTTPTTGHDPSVVSTNSEVEYHNDQPKENDSEEIRRRNHAAEAKGKNIHASGAPVISPSWADIMEKENGVKFANGATNRGRDGVDMENRPKVFFGRSMADALRSGQPTEGPILLDHARAQKRGEVRMVEGRPCLFFSSDESTDLAGRIGPAIVGKFSHSIPTAHQIQKALGNIKLKGTLSWNFLNAKHVFIQLSEMNDYVRILNGPNNSPVWYIEHHPMRVFKWTPQFDPFFEIPIVALWCNILALPVHLFEESALIAIGNLFGHAVQVDRATITRSRVSFARICVEVDISQPIPEEITLDIAGKRVTLKIKWDKIPLYCRECQHVGHSADNCYAFGRRPMPPKKDYSHGAPSKPGPSYQRTGDQPPGRQERGDLHQETTHGRGQEGQPRGGHASGAHHIGVPQVGSFGGWKQTLETQQPERHQVQRPDVRILQKETAQPELGLKAKGYLFDAGPSGTAMAGTHEVEDEGFLMPKKKKKTRSAASRARKRERQRQKKKQMSTPAEAESEGGGNHGSDGQDSASESESGTGSLSPSYRPRHVDGPLAIVAVNSNMFGALEDFPSEDEEGRHIPAFQDTWMVEASASRTRFLECEDHGTGHTSPPPEGKLKKARLGASGPH